MCYVASSCHPDTLRVLQHEHRVRGTLIDALDSSINIDPKTNKFICRPLLDHMISSTNKLATPAAKLATVKPLVNEFDADAINHNPISELDNETPLHRACCMGELKLME